MKMQTSGKEVVLLIYTLVKAINLYDVNNDVVRNAAQKFINTVNSFFITTPNIELFRYHDYVFFNKQRLKFEIYNYASLQFLYDRLKNLKLKSLTFLPGISRDEIITFASIFMEENDSFLKQLESKKFNHIHPEFGTTDDETPDFLQQKELESREDIKRTYFSALKSLKNLMQGVRKNQTVSLKAIRRVVYRLIDFLHEDELSLLALTTIKNFDEYTFNHSLNVGVLSMAMGHRIGLSKTSLVALGNAAILHDIGKVKIPREIINKIDRLTDEEWETIKRHSNYGVIEIMKSKGLDEIGLISMIVSFQHHWNYDGTGYPPKEKNEKQNLFSKIVRICDAYDAMTTSRPYQPVSYLPHYVMKVLWIRRNTWFDPILVKVFIQLLGLYPVGSCVEVSTGEIGLVLRQNPGYCDLPVIKIVIDKKGNKTDGRTIDLTLEGTPRIIKPTYPQKYGIIPLPFFL